jgi:fermentation-respiration switch protein FrsA (DUF1100 family)
MKKILLGEFSLIRLFRLLLLIPVTGYGTLLYFALFKSNEKMFFPPPTTYADTTTIIKLRTKDGIQISAQYLKHPQAQYTLLYSHGNAEDMGIVLPVLQEIYEQGFSVFTYDYQGYGTSQGFPSEQGSYVDIGLAYHYLTKNLEIPPTQVIAHGRSVGGGPTLWLATKYPVAGVILESTFVSAFRVVTQIPLLPFDRYPNLARIRKLSAPVLIIHGVEDDLIPIWHSRELYQEAPDPKTFLWLEGAGHNTVGGETYWKALREFANGLTHEQSKY